MTGIASSRLVRLAVLGPAAACLLLSFGTAEAAAEPAAKKAPRRAIPARTAASAPDKTGSIAEPAKPVAPPAKNADAQVELVPFYLPDVPRARMRACGETWRDKKMRGDVGDEAWRDFAIKCLAADTSAGSR